MTETPANPDEIDVDTATLAAAGETLGRIQAMAYIARKAFQGGCTEGIHAELRNAGICGCDDEPEATPEERAARAEAEQIITRITEAYAKRPTVVVLCGSTRFSHAFREANLTETLAGRIVLSIGCDMRTDTELFADLDEEALAKVKAQLDELHLRKIDLADEVLVLNVGGYVGDSTRREIDYAISHGKPIRWLESGIEDTPEALAERARPFVACKAPDPSHANYFCGRAIGHDPSCRFVPVEELPASADDEGDEAADKAAMADAEADRDAEMAQGGVVYQPRDRSPYYH